MATKTSKFMTRAMPIVAAVTLGISPRAEAQVHHVVGGGGGGQPSIHNVVSTGLNFSGQSIHHTVPTSPVNFGRQGQHNNFNDQWHWNGNGWENNNHQGGNHQNFGRGPYQQQLQSWNNNYGNNGYGGIGYGNRNYGFWSGNNFVRFAYGAYGGWYGYAGYFCFRPGFQPVWCGDVDSYAQVCGVLGVPANIYGTTYSGSTPVSQSVNNYENDRPAPASRQYDSSANSTDQNALIAALIRNGQTPAKNHTALVNFLEGCGATLLAVGGIALIGFGLKRRSDRDNQTASDLSAIRTVLGSVGDTMENLEAKVTELDERARRPGGARPAPAPATA